MLLSFVAGVTCLGATTLSGQVGVTELEAIKQQMAQMQADYEKRLSQMETKMKSMETEMAVTAAFAKGKTIEGPDGKQIPAPLPPLDTFTRNLKLNGYVRAGVGFTGNGVGQTNSFVLPAAVGGRIRLGNENDMYMELSPSVHHMLGDDPEQMDVMTKATFAFVNSVDKETYVGLKNAGFDFAFREIFIEFKNVIKSAPEVTFWGGQRFYDRYDIHEQDYYFLDSSGYGGGVYNINLGIGNLAIAYFGGIRDGLGNALAGGSSYNQFLLDVDGGQGDFYRHTVDIRLGDINFLWGKLKLVGLGSYQRGGTFTMSNGGEANVDNSWGAGGGAVYQYDLPESFGKFSFLQLAALYGYGLINFDPTGVDLGKLSSAYSSALAAQGLPAGSFVSLNPYNNSQRARANFNFIWNPTENFSLGFWGIYQFNDQGFTSYQTNADGSLSSAGPDQHYFSVGVRPVFWIYGPFAIQGQAGYNYVSNVYSGSALGRDGGMGIFSIAPTIKPRGGFFTRPELRAFATYAVWSDSLKGAVGGPYYATANQGWTFGVQAEAWW